MASFRCSLALCAALAAAPAFAQDAAPVLQVRLDEASILRLRSPAQTIVIGNPAIADAMVHDGSTLVVTGKSFGATNLIALDRTGNVIAERQIQVGQPRSSIVTVQRGDELETYACAPQCRRAPVIGDSQRTFTEALSQTQARTGLAAGSTSR